MVISWTRPDMLFSKMYTKSFSLEGDVCLEMAHIYGEKPTSARHNPTLSLEEANSSNNIVLLCPNHHTEIDGRTRRDSYPPETIQAWKQEHESKNSFYEVPDELCERIQQQSHETINLKNVQSDSISNYAGTVITHNHYYQSEISTNRGDLAVETHDQNETKPPPQERRKKLQVKAEPLKTGSQHKADARSQKAPITPIQSPLDNNKRSKTKPSIVAKSAIKFRIYARLLDYLIWLGVLAAAIAVSLIAPTASTENLIATLLTAVFVSVYETVNGGKTIGKKTFHLEIRNKNNQRISTQKAIMRSYNSYLSVFLLPLIMLSGEEGQRTTSLQQIANTAGVVFLIVFLALFSTSVILLFTEKQTLWDKTSKTLVCKTN